jgi:two-component system alkaline phosphatase synthesis response regulator PhoP
VSKKIVVADDETHILHVVSMKLANAGYSVLTAVDGEEAYDLCLAEKPDLVITDYQMPVLTGLEMIQRLRENESTRDTPVMMLSARGFDIPPEEMSRLRIAEVLSKPFSPREVLLKVQTLLGEVTQPAER